MTQIFETTDAPETTATPYAMEAGDEFFGALTQLTGDWVAVTLQAGTKYSFGAVGIGPMGRGVKDPELVLHRADGSVVVSNDDGGPGLSAKLTYTAAATATYYVEVISLAGHPGAEYGLSMALGGKASFGVELGAAELYRPGSSWAPAPATAVTVSWAFRASGPATDAAGVAAPFHLLTSAQKAAVQYALANFSDVANISFEQHAVGGTTNDATILIGAYTSTTDGAGAYAQFPGATGSSAIAGDLWLNTDSVEPRRLPIGSYSQWVMIHELGHAMGLAHPGDYNAAPGVSITYAKNAQSVEDSGQYSVMSYFDATDTAPNAPKHYADTLMLYDIYAVQQLYGVNMATNAGDSVYGFHSTVGGAFDYSKHKAPLQCIWDGAGNDTIDVSGFSQAQKIDLREGHFSDVGGFEKNVSIALGARIENAIGGSGNDQIIGNDLVNRLSGRGGDDILESGGGNDRLTGNLGADYFLFVAGTGRDTVTDFDNGLDTLALSTSLWGGTVAAAADVVAAFGVMRGGHVVLDFGTDAVILPTTHSLVGLETHVLIL